jgi:glycosyltransferase involved in cell wall biosynthesis
VYSAHENVIKKINELNSIYKLSIEYSSRSQEINQEELLEKFGQAKIAIGNSITDGIPNTLLEAIILGAFPIQSNPGGVSEEYIKDGLNGFLIHNPFDLNEISTKIKKSLENEALLENATFLNKEISLELSDIEIRQRVLGIYQEIESEL